jgi:carbon-monoxide dehydrogenase medium subunit
VQVPAPFDYERASSIDQAVALLERHGPEARLLAGGHSLLPMMKLRLARPEVLIDINDVPGLSDIRIDGTDLVIGALVRHAQLLDSPLVREHYRIFTDAERVIADPIVRNRGTVGGSLCQADPSEDLSAAFAAVRAQIVIHGAGGQRVVPSDQFHTGPYETAVGPAEILTEVRVPIRPGGGSAYEKVERRAGDWAIAAVGAAIWLDGDTITDVGIGLTAVGAAHFMATAAEAALRGRPVSEDAIDRAGDLAADATNPATDQRGPADYKRHLAGELTKRALRRAIARARGQEA